MSEHGYNAAWIAAARRAINRAESVCPFDSTVDAMRDLRHALVMLEKGPCTPASSCDKASCGPVYVGGGWSAEDQRRADARKAAAATIAVSPKHRHFKFRYHRRKRA